MFLSTFLTKGVIPIGIGMESSRLSQRRVALDSQHFLSFVHLCEAFCPLWWPPCRGKGRKKGLEEWLPAPHHSFALVKVDSSFWSTVFTPLDLFRKDFLLDPTFFCKTKRGTGKNNRNLVTNKSLLRKWCLAQVTSRHISSEFFQNRTNKRRYRISRVKSRRKRNGIHLYAFYKVKLIYGNTKIVFGPMSSFAIGNNQNNVDFVVVFCWVSCPNLPYAKILEHLFGICYRVMLIHVSVNRFGLIPQFELEVSEI